jgi:hypothetical protein
MKCKDHPDAPHGFDRNTSHNEGRYVCECESWEPSCKREWIGLTDEEALDVWGKVELGQTEEHGALLLYKAFESKLKEKNT